MEKRDKPITQYDVKHYERKLRKAKKNLSKIEKALINCPASEIDANLSLYREAYLKVKQLKNRVEAPSAKFDFSITVLSNSTYE